MCWSCPEYCYLLSLANTVDLDGEENLAARDQILMRIFTTVLNHCMKTEIKGWVAVDEALWSF